MFKSFTSTDAKQPHFLTYRAYRTNQSGGYDLAEIIVASSDEEAKSKASELINGHGIDLWERARFLARYPSLSVTEEN